MIAAGVLCVDRVVPTVSINSPPAGAANGTVLVSALAADNDAIAYVQFQIDGANWNGPAYTAPYQYYLDTHSLVNGNHTIRALAYDREGNMSVAQITITCGNVPAVQMTAPGNGASVAGVITLSANVTNYGSGINVQFYRDGSPIGPAMSAGPYQYNYDTRGDVNGNHTFSVVATDAQNNQASSQVSVTYNNVPVVAVTSPAAGDVAGTIAISANVTQYGSGCTVYFQLDGSNLTYQQGGNGAYSYSYDTHAIVNGSHWFRVVVIDYQNNATYGSLVYVTVKNVPTVAWTSPAAGNLSGTVTFSANVTGYGTGITVQFQVDGTNIGPQMTSGPYSINYDTHGVGNGSHTFRVIATDAQGNQTIVSQTNNVANVPAVNFYSPGSGATVTGTMTLASYVTHYASNVSVWYYIDGSNIYGLNGGTGYYSVNYDTHLKGVGWHTITVIAQDNLGNQTRIDYNVYVNNQVPAQGFVSLGDVMVLDDDGNYYSGRYAPEPYDGTGGNWYWSATGQKFAPVYLPG